MNKASSVKFFKEVSKFPSKALPKKSFPDDKICYDIN